MGRAGVRTIFLRTGINAIISKVTTTAAAITISA